MGYSDVATMGKETGYYYRDVPGRPTLRPWIVTESFNYEIIHQKMKGVSNSNVVDDINHRDSTGQCAG